MDLKNGGAANAAPILKCTTGIVCNEKGEPNVNPTYEYQTPVDVRDNYISLKIMDEQEKGQEQEQGPEQE